MYLSYACFNRYCFLLFKGDKNINSILQIITIFCNLILFTSVFDWVFNWMEDKLECDGYIVVMTGVREIELFLQHIQPKFHGVSNSKYWQPHTDPC